MWWGAGSQLSGCLCCSLFIYAWIASFRSVGYWWYLLSKCGNTSGTSIWIYILEIFDGYEIIAKIVINKFEFLDKAFISWSLSPNAFWVKCCTNWAPTDTGCGVGLPAPSPGSWLRSHHYSYHKISDEDTTTGPTCQIYKSSCSKIS